MRDLGFEVSKRGTFTFERSLDPNSPYKAAAKLKIVFNDDLTGFKMNTVNASGTVTMNIFTSSRADEFVTQYHYMLAEMVERGIFEKS
ncbi:cysteine desulfurase [Paucilactobacillus hokkaidonensis]|uniref:cysteine desulfurase n=1 Tax=Paucilactobacillus hokkaidonensis TaxID=1193095 RepID=UPI0034E21498